MKTVAKGIWSIAGFLPIPGRTEYMAASGANTLGTYGSQGHFMEKNDYEKSMQDMRDNYDITKSYSENRQKALGNAYYTEGSKSKSNEGRNATYVTAGRSWISRATNVVMGLTAGFVGRNIFNMAAGVLATGWNLATAAPTVALWGLGKTAHSIFTGKLQYNKEGFQKAANLLPKMSVPVPHSPAHWIKYYAQNTPNAMDVFHERGLLEGIRAAIHFNVYRPVYDFFADFKRESGNLKFDNLIKQESSNNGMELKVGETTEAQRRDYVMAKIGNATHAKGPSHLSGGGLQTAWGPLTNMFKRLKNIGKFLTFQGIGSGILDPEKEEIAERAKADTAQTLAVDDKKDDDDD